MLAVDKLEPDDRLWHSGVGERLPERPGADIEITVPPGVRVEMDGFGVTRGRADGELERALPPDAPVVRVRGFAYKGQVTTHTGAPQR